MFLTTCYNYYKCDTVFDVRYCYNYICVADIETFCSCVRQLDEKDVCWNDNIYMHILKP